MHAIATYLTQTVRTGHTGRHAFPTAIDSAITMKRVEVELYSQASNAAIVRVPERRFPGLVFQGDTLSSLHARARQISVELRQSGVQNEEVLYAAQELQAALLAGLLHYQHVLAAHGISLPYVGAVDEADLVRLVPEENDEA